MSVYAHNAKNQSKVNSSTSSKHEDKKAVSSFVDNRITTVMQRKLKSVLNKNNKAESRKTPKANAVVQGIFSVQGEITTLNELNEVLGVTTSEAGNSGIAPPITMADFTRGQTEEELDEAIKNSKEFIHDYIERKTIVQYIDEELEKITAPPEGYVLETNESEVSIFMKSPFALNAQQTKLLISAAHGMGNAVHQSSKTKNMSAQADAYIHDYTANAIFSYKNAGIHRGIPKVDVLQQGNVNAGNHNF